MDVTALVDILIIITMWSLLFLIVYLKKCRGYFQRRKSPQNEKIRLGFFSLLFIYAFFPLSLLFIYGREIK